MEHSSEIPPANDYGVMAQQHEEEYEYMEHEGELPEDALYDEEDEEEYDEDLDEEELSSSPSIPDENINFDLVYALHTFIATVDGQATVQKGDHLVLLDDSNSYWWLVRVMASQEVGYIPAENIETPYERLARLNKHRNVEITTATENDHDQVPMDLYSGHLVKSRSRGAVDVQSGKPSALSRRDRSGRPEQRRSEQRKRGVLFGQSEYVEHSGNEASDEEYAYEEYDEEYEEYDEYDEYAEGVYEQEHARSPLGDGAEQAGLQARSPTAAYDAEDARALRAQSTTPTAPGTFPLAAETSPKLASDTIQLRQRATPSPRISPCPAPSVIGLFAPDAVPGDSAIPMEGNARDSAIRSDEARRSRPGSLVGIAGSVPMFNVVRVFAGENVESAATFKTALLNKTTTCTDLVRQAMQRFSVEDDPADYLIVLRRMDGQEHTLLPHESPLQVLESISEGQEGERSPNRPRDSIGSIASLLQDVSVERATYDYSDDRFGKFYLMRKGPYFERAETSPFNDPHDSPSMHKFTVQLALFPTDLPEGVVFDPQTGLATHNEPAQAIPASAKPQTRFLRFARNATVADVVEAALEAYQVTEGVVDGGDNVEQRGARGRVTYGLASVSEAGEQMLAPTSKVLAAYDTLPLFTPELRRTNLDMMSPGAQEDLLASDPLFVLRRARSSPRAAAFSPIPELHGWGTPGLAFSPWLGSELDGPLGDTRPIAPRAVPTVQFNSEQGVDLVMRNGVRLRSARQPHAPQVRYSLLSQTGSEQDASEAVHQVLYDITAKHGARDGDLLECFVEQFPSMEDASISEHIDNMLRHITESSGMRAAQQAPPPPPQVVPPRFAPVTAPTPGLHIPNKPAPLNRSGSLRSASASDAATSRSSAARTVERTAPADRVVSDTTAATGTGRKREMYNIHALYSIVDALVLDAKSDAALNKSHRRTGSASSQGSQSVHRASMMAAKLMEASPAESLYAKSNGLLALRFPDSQQSMLMATVQQQYAPHMAHIQQIERSLDALLAAALHVS